MMKIGELARLVGVSQDTLRFYEKNSLLKPDGRSASGYRLYSEDNAQRIRFILSAKDVGFTLNEIQELLDIQVTRDEHSCQEVKQFVDAKAADVATRIKELKRIQRSLKSLSQACCGGAEPATHCTILEALADTP